MNVKYGILDMFQKLKLSYNRMLKRPADEPNADVMDRHNLYVRFVMRPFAYLPTLALYKMNVSPNSATWFGFIIILLSSSYFFVYPLNDHLMTAIFINIYFIFDHIDGNLARLYKTTNQYGKFLDGTLGYIGEIIFIPCISYAIFIKTDMILILFVGYYIVILESIYKYIHLRVLVDKNRETSNSITSPVDKQNQHEDISGKSIKYYFYKYKVYEKYYLQNISAIKFGSLLIFAYLDALNYYILLYAITITMVLIPYIIIEFIRAKIILNFHRST